MAEHEGRRQQAGRVPLEVVEQPDVGVAGARAGHLEQHLPGSGGGTVHVLEDGKGLVPLEDDSAHDSLLLVQNAGARA